MSENSRMVRGIFLDFDGTLVDSSDAYIEAAKRAHESIGSNAFDARMALEIPKRLELKQPLKEIPSASRSEFLEAYLKTFYEITIEKSRPFSYTDDALRELSQKAKLALVTMRFTPKASVLAELRNFDLEKYFSYVATGLDTPSPKPSPQALLKAADHLNERLCDCMIVGDSVSDARAGKAADIITVSVLSGLFTREELTREKPDLILETVKDLPSRLDSLK